MTNPSSMSTQSQDKPAGSAEVQQFYDHVGWTTRADGVVDDTARFGVLRSGDLQDRLHRERVDRIREAFAPVSGRPAVIECGCGGNPATLLLDVFPSYTGVDFSETGLQLAATRVPSDRQTRFVKADLTALPFDDASFDAAYSAHVLYHIPTADGQARAFAEIMRVLRPGGIAVLILANPRPLLFPVRLARRLLFDLPVLGPMIDRKRKKGPLPYLPMGIGWMRKQLQPVADVNITSHAIASVWFAQHVSDRSMIGKALWRIIGWLEASWPRTSARMGNFVMIVATRK